MTDANKQLFNAGDLVFAKMRSYPPWPAQIIDATLIGSSQKVAVQFLGTNEIGYIRRADLFDYEKCRHTLAIPKKIRGFVEGLKQIEDLYAERTSQKTAETSAQEILALLDNQANLSSSFSAAPSPVKKPPKGNKKKTTPKTKIFPAAVEKTESVEKYDDCDDTFLNSPVSILERLGKSLKHSPPSPTADDTTLLADSATVSSASTQSGKRIRKKKEIPDDFIVEFMPAKRKSILSSDSSNAKTTPKVKRAKIVDKLPALSEIKKIAAAEKETSSSDDRSSVAETSVDNYELAEDAPIDTKVSSLKIKLKPILKPKTQKLSTSDASILSDLETIKNTTTNRTQDVRPQRQTSPEKSARKNTKLIPDAIHTVKNDALKQSQPKNETDEETEMFALAYGFWYDAQAKRIKASKAEIRNKPDSIRQVLKREWELLDKDKKQMYANLAQNVATIDAISVKIEQDSDDPIKKMFCIPESTENETVLDETHVEDTSNQRKRKKSKLFEMVESSDRNLAMPKKKIGLKLAKEKAMKANIIGPNIALDKKLKPRVKNETVADENKEQIDQDDRVSVTKSASSKKSRQSANAADLGDLAAVIQRRSVMAPVETRYRWWLSSGEPPASGLGRPRKRERSASPPRPLPVDLGSSTAVLQMLAKAMRQMGNKLQKTKEPGCAASEETMLDCAMDTFFVSVVHVFGMLRFAPTFEPCFPTESYEMLVEKTAYLMPL